MRGKISLLAGGAIGYVLGTRAGRERYEQIKSQAQSVWNNPKVQEKAAQAQDLAKEKAPLLKDKVSDATSSSSPSSSSPSSGSPSSGTVPPSTSPSTPLSSSPSTSPSTPPSSSPSSSSPSTSSPSAGQHRVGGDPSGPTPSPTSATTGLS